MAGGHALSRWWPADLSVLLGLWLVLSVLAVPNAESSAGFNRLMIGTFVAANAVIAMWASWFRFMNTVLGVWLLFSALMFEHASAFRLLSTLAVAAAIVVLSLVPTPSRLIDPRRPAEA